MWVVFLVQALQQSNQAVWLQTNSQGKAGSVDFLYDKKQINFPLQITEQLFCLSDKYMNILETTAVHDS